MKTKAKVPKKLKTLIIDSLRRHAWNMGVSEYRVDILWMHEDKETREGSVYADMTPDRRYLQTDLKIYPRFIAEWKKRGNDFLEEVIAHEVGHLATAHLHWLAISTYKDDGELTDAWEILTERIGRLSVTLDNKLRKKK